MEIISILLFINSFIMKTKLLFAISITFSFFVNAQTYVPDDIFEQKLIDLGYDSGPLDDYVPTANISAVTTLSLNGLPINDLTGIEDFAALDNIFIRYANITNLDLSLNTLLTRVNCPSNGITTININGLTNLDEIILFDNNITSVDLSTNLALTKFNGGQNPYTTLDFSDNPNITFIGSPFGSLTSIDLAGLTNIEEVYINDNQITSIDVSGNSSLFWLDAFNNNLTSLNISGATALQYCNIYNNQLSSIDVSTNLNLLGLGCSNNLLTTLDVSTNSVLSGLNVRDNLLTSIDLVGANALSTLNCSNNQLTALDINSNTNLQLLTANNNNLDTIGLTNAIALTNITLNDNLLTTLDLSNNSNFTFLNLNNNALTSLNVKNGNNTAINSNWFRVQNNSSLSCIDVDDAAYSTSNWNFVDTGVIYSENCATMSVDEDTLNKIEVYPNPTSDYIHVKGIDLSNFKIQIFDMLGKQITTSSLNSDTIDVSNLIKGMYLIKVTKGSKTQTLKFIKN